MNPKMLATWSYYIGLAIVVATHVYMLAAGLPANMMMGHAILNLVAAGLVAFGWMKLKR